MTAIARPPAPNHLRGWIIVGVLIVALLVLPHVLPLFWLRIATGALMWVGLAASWNVLGGYAGYVNFGHGAFFGLGAYAVALTMNGGMNFYLALIVAGIAAGLLAFIVGGPTLRLQGAYFAIATWALAKGLEQLALVMEVTGGPNGLRLPAYLEPRFFYYMMFAVTALTMLVYYLLLERGTLGVRLKAIREDESASRALGLNPARLKMVAFVLSAIPAGILGGVYAYQTTFINPQSVLGDIITDQAVVMAVFGGLGSFWGPAIGAVSLWGLNRFFWTAFSDSVFYLVILGIVICASVLLLPEGVWGWIQSRLHGAKHGHDHPSPDDNLDAKNPDVAARRQKGNRWLK